MRGILRWEWAKGRMFQVPFAAAFKPIIYILMNGVTWAIRGFLPPTLR